MFLFQMQASEGVLSLQEEAPFPNPRPLAVPTLPEPMMAAHRGNGATRSSDAHQQHLPPLLTPPPPPSAVHPHNLLLPHPNACAVRHHQLYGREQHHGHILSLSTHRQSFLSVPALYIFWNDYQD